MRALLVLCLLAGRASADVELPTIESEFPPTLRVSSGSWGTKIERVAVAIRSAPEPTFVTVVVTGREREITLSLDVPADTKVVGLGTDGIDGRAWSRPLPHGPARDQHLNKGGSLLEWTGTTAEQDHITISVSVPSTIEIALYLPPLQRLAIASDAGLLAVDVGGQHFVNKQRRVVVELDDIAGTAGTLAMPHATAQTALVAAQSPPSDFAPHDFQMGPRAMRDIDKSIIRRRMKWYQPQLRECFMREAQWIGGPRSGGAVVSFMIVADGTVEWAHTSESDLPASITECLVEEVKRWEFPEADGNVQVNYPLDFRTY